MPSKDTLAKRKLIHSKQVAEGKTNWLCVRCNKEFPKEDFITKRNGYRMKCKTCADKENQATSNYRKKHMAKVTQNSKYYEEKRKLKREEIINKHDQMVKDGCDVLICTKCKQEKPIQSFRNHTGGITRQCYECRQANQIIESKRSPDSRTRAPRVVVKNENHYSCHKYCSYRRYDISKGFVETKEEFEKLLPRDYAYKMMKTRCSYCNTYEPSKIGLDRVDPTKPHTMFNVMPCCETCNIAKSVMGLKAYISHMKKIASVTKYWKSPTGLNECPF